MAAAARPPVMSITTPLKEALLFHRMNAREELGRLSEFEIDLLSTRKDIDFAGILGKNVTVRMELATGDERHFDGYVTRFSQIGMRGRYHLYHASVRPWLWFLTRTSDCKIFQGMTVPDILKKVFEDHSIAVVEYKLTGTYRTWEYCVQYRETDFDFVSRLMEQEGIYYYFTHEAGRHTMVVTDSYGGHEPFPDHAEIPFVPVDRVRPDKEAILEWTFSHEIQAGRYVIDDYNFTEPKVGRQVSEAIVRQNTLSDYELYDYPGEFEVKDEGEHYVNARIEEVQSQFELAQGRTNSRGLCTGCLFTLKSPPRADQGREYLVVGATHDLEYSEYESLEGGGSDYGCTFKAMYAKEHAFRPQRITPKPVVQGPQTAVVVGPAGDEIHTDEYGRIKVQFHWDRYGEKNENSSCYMRVAQVWAGNNWGATFVPRIGQEVVVSFLEGDPDQPLVIGSVYNAIQKPPYLGEGRDSKHKNDPHVSGIKTNSTKGGSGYNELRFDDTAGKEQVFLHGQYDMDVRVENTVREHIGADRHTLIGANQIDKIDDSVWLQIKNNENATVGGDRKETIGGNHDFLVKGNQNAEVKGVASLTVGQNLQEKVGQNAALDAGMEIHLKAGMKLILEAGMQISLKAAGNFIDIGPAGISIQGVMVMINSGGAAGSGGGSSPTAPQEAEKKDPDEADKSSSGSKSAD
ncbi:MAG: type VI secretion system Vgr family protein [Burkholderiales bacterium]